MKKFLTKNIMKVSALTLMLVLTMAFAFSVGAQTNVMYGDVDASGVDNASDALLVLKHAAKIDLLTSETEIKVADVNADTSIDAKDALLILQKAAKLIDKYPAEDVVTSTPEATEEATAEPTEKPQLTPIPTRVPSASTAPIVYPTMIPLPEVSADPANYVEGQPVTLTNLNGATEADGIYTFTDENAANKKGISFANPFAGKTELVETIEKGLEGQSINLTEDQKVKYDPTATYHKPVWSTGASISFWAKYEWGAEYYSPEYPILVIHNSSRGKAEDFAIQLSLNGEVKFEGGEDPANSFRAEGFVMGNYNEWNYYTITFANDFITVYVNGQECAYQSIDLKKQMTSLFNAGFMTRYNTPGDITEEQFANDIRKYYTSSGVYKNGVTDKEATIVDNRVYEGTGMGLGSELLMSFLIDEGAEVVIGGCETTKVNSKSLGDCAYLLKSGTQAAGLEAYFTELTPEQVAANYAAAAAEFLK